MSIKESLDCMYYKSEIISQEKVMIISAKPITSIISIFEFLLLQADWLLALGGRYMGEGMGHTGRRVFSTTCML